MHSPEGSEFMNRELCFVRCRDAHSAAYIIHGYRLASTKRASLPP